MFSHFVEGLQSTFIASWAKRFFYVCVYRFACSLDRLTKPHVEVSFTDHKEQLLLTNQSDLEIEIDVLRERLVREGVRVR